MNKLFFIRWREWVKSMILIGSLKIKNKNVVRDQLKIKIYNEEDLCDLLSKKDNEQKEIFFLQQFYKSFVLSTIVIANDNQRDMLVNIMSARDP